MDCYAGISCGETHHYGASEFSTGKVRKTRCAAALGRYGSGPDGKAFVFSRRRKNGRLTLRRRPAWRYKCALPLAVQP